MVVAWSAQRTLGFGGEGPPARAQPAGFSARWRQARIVAQRLPVGKAITRDLVRCKPKLGSQVLPLRLLARGRCGT